MKRTILQKALLGFMATVVTALMIEMLAHWLVKPSKNAFGILLGLELPPRRIVSHSEPGPFQDPVAPFRKMIVDGKQITSGDLWGHFRLDPVIGYVYQENVTSRNGWWQSNNLGARARTNVSRAVPAGRTRVLVFGESFGHGSRLPQERAWPNVIGDQHQELEVLNFAVDGYSMAQSLLRYRQIRKQLKYEIALLVFVPEEDLWRDINTLRQLRDPSWEMPLMPRFVISDGELQLVPVLYPDPFDLYRRNGDGLSPELRAYLRRYDRLYFPAKYEEHPVTGKLMLYKLLARALWVQQERRLHANLMNPEGEALIVSRAIFDAMRQQVTADGAAFVLVILPSEYHWWSGTTKQSRLQDWRRMVSFVCAEPMVCIDLLPELRSLAPKQVDRTYDGHFGPKMNLWIATAVHNALKVRLSIPLPKTEAVDVN